MNAQDIVNPVRGARVSYCGICTPHWVPSGRPKLTTNAQETMDEEFMQAQQKMYKVEGTCMHGLAALFTVVGSWDQVCF